MVYKNTGRLAFGPVKAEELRGGRKDRRLYTVAILDCYTCTNRCCLPSSVLVGVKFNLPGTQF